MDGSLEELRERAMDAHRWEIRNLAVKELGRRLGEKEAKVILFEVISDRRPAVWWRRWLGDPFYQVGFTRRNAWKALLSHTPSLREVEPLIKLGLDDPYYEVRTATWAVLSEVLGREGDMASQEMKEDLKNRIIREDNFEILTAALGALDRVFSIESLLEWAERVEKFKHWKVRAAYLEAMERCCQRGDLSHQRVDAILKRFNLRSEYFRPVFMLKERGSQLEQTLKVEA